MTKVTPPGIKTEWEPINEGIQLWMDEAPGKYDPIAFSLSIPNARELMYDMEEAVMLSRGYQKHSNVEVCNVPDTWIVSVCGNDFRIASTFVEARSKYNGAWYCLQDDQGREIVLPADDLVTAYEPVE